MNLHALTGDDAREDSATGELVLEGRTGEPASAGGVRLWAGRIADSFYIDLSLLAKVNGAVKTGPRSTCRRGGRRTRRTASPAPPSNRSCSRSPTSIRSCGPAPASASGAPPSSPPTPAAGGRSTGPVIPMMWPIFWPDDTDSPIPANTRHPSEGLRRGRRAHRRAHRRRRRGQRDLGRPAGLRRRPWPGSFPRRPALRGRARPATFGFAGRNGRTLADNAPEVMLSLVAGTAVPPGSSRRSPRTYEPTSSRTSCRRASHRCSSDARAAASQAKHNYRGRTFNFAARSLSRGRSSPCAPRPGSSPRTFLTRAGSIRAETIPTPSEALATTWPQGSATSEWP